MHEPETDAAPGVTSDTTKSAPQYPSCLTGMLDREGAPPVRFEIEPVLVGRGRQAGGPAPAADVGPEVVPLVDYAEVDPDLFDELGPSLATHLTEDHQDLLLELGRRLDI